LKNCLFNPGFALKNCNHQDLILRHRSLTCTSSGWVCLRTTYQRPDLYHLIPRPRFTIVSLLFLDPRFIRDFLFSRSHSESNRVPAHSLIVGHASPLHQTSNPGLTDPALYGRHLDRVVHEANFTRLFTHYSIFCLLPVTYPSTTIGIISHIFKFVKRFLASYVKVRINAVSCRIQERICLPWIVRICKLNLRLHNSS